MKEASEVGVHVACCGFKEKLVHVFYQVVVPPTPAALHVPALRCLHSCRREIFFSDPVDDDPKFERQGRKQKYL